MRSFHNRYVHHVRGVVVTIIVICVATSALAEKIVIRSGTVGTTPLTPGSFWTQAHGLVSTQAKVAVYPFVFSFPFGGAFISSCQSTSSPKVIAPAPGWILGLPWNPPARWVSYTTITPDDKPPGRSSLLCIPFTITTAATFKATLKFTWAVDDRLGDPAGGKNTDGVYVNLHGCNITGGSFSAASSAEVDITAFAQTGGNTLHIYQRDTLGADSGIIFSAVITVCPVGTGAMDVVVRSGTINGATANADQSVDQKCDRGKQNKPLDLDFSNCTKSTYVDGVNTWNGNPPGADPAARWLYWKNGFGNRKPLSALVRAPFYIPWAVSSATLTFSGTADDRLGDPNSDGSNPNGVYINGVGVSPAIRSSSFTTLTTATATVAVNKGWNNLYVYTRDVLDISAGTIFSATFHIVGGQPCSSINDPYDQGNPAPIRAFSGGPGQVNVVFDRDITIASAQNLSNYQIDHGAVITDAMLGIDGRSALLTLADESPWGTLEHVTVSGVVAADTTVSMPQAVSVPFFSGVQTTQLLQAPDPASLGAVPCVDRSGFAGPDSLPGEPVTVVGTCMGRALECYTLMDSVATTRSGILVSGSSVEMATGKRYRVTGRVLESDGETVLMDIMDVKDLGTGNRIAPISRPISTFQRTACDAGQAQETGEDFEGMLVFLNSVSVVQALHNQSFLVKARFGTAADTLRVCGIDATFPDVPPVGTQLSIRGVLVFRGGRFQVAARDSDDFLSRSPMPPPPLPKPTVYPNPANPSVTISFEVARAMPVEIAIYDIRGALVRKLANRSFPAGSHKVVWNGVGDTGARVASGMYFYRISAVDWSDQGKVIILK